MEVCLRQLKNVDLLMECAFSFMLCCGLASVFILFRLLPFLYKVDIEVS